MFSIHFDLLYQFICYISSILSLIFSFTCICVGISSILKISGKVVLKFPNIFFYFTSSTLNGQHKLFWGECFPVIFSRISLAKLWIGSSKTLYFVTFFCDAFAMSYEIFFSTILVTFFAGDHIRLVKNRLFKETYIAKKNLIFMIPPFFLNKQGFGEKYILEKANLNDVFF